jgi:hypothetical protein
LSGTELEIEDGGGTPRPDIADGGVPPRPELDDGALPRRLDLDEGLAPPRPDSDEGGWPLERADGDSPGRPAIEVCGCPARPTIEARPDIDEGGGTTTTTEGGATGGPKPEARMPFRPANPCTNWSTGWVSVLLVEPVPG